MRKLPIKSLLPVYEPGSLKKYGYSSLLVCICCGQGGITLPKKIPIFYSALLLTGVNLLLRVVGTSFQVYVSGRIGAAGVGLLQLVMSVGSLAMVAGMAGIRTAAMYLTAEELGRKLKGNVTWVLSACFLYSVLCSSTVATMLYLLAPWIAVHWIGSEETLGALRMLAAFLPVTCLCGVMTGYFTAANRIEILAAVEVAEQLVSMVVTMTALSLWTGGNAGRACESVVLGNGMGACLTMVCLAVLRLREPVYLSDRIRLGRRLYQTAIPLGLADVVKSGINTMENLMVPRRLALNLQVAQPLAAFGMVSGMVFPVMMFPACILFGLAELLIPELARCAAAGSGKRISYLVRRSLKVAMIYGVFFSGLMFLLSEKLCLMLYGNEEAGLYLKRYTLLIPMLYCDCITDAMTKGLGQQRSCVRYNILTSAMDVVFLYILLPRYGMKGYFISFLVTHLINFLLSIRRLLRITGEKIPFFIPALAISAGMGAGWGASHMESMVSRGIVYIFILGSLWCVFGITGREDIQWLRGLIKRGKSPA